MEPFFGFGPTPILFSQLAKARLYLQQKKGGGKRKRGRCHAHCTKIPFMYSFSGNFAASVPISNFNIHIYIPRIVPHISCSRIGRPILEIYKSLTDI
jgi:hypothetical protein